MAHALSNSDFASKMATGANDHVEFFQLLSNCEWETPTYRKELNRGDQRAQRWIHEAMNYQAHQAEY